MTLHMIQLTPDMVPAAVWAQQNGVASADEGYLMHALLAASFDTLAPKPFVMMAAPGRPAKMLAYSSHSAEELRDQARMFAEPGAMAALGVGAMVSKPMPETFAKGARLGFEVRVRPIIREARTGRERDAFLAAIHDLPKDTVVDRSQVYCDWLARVMSPGAEIRRVEPAYERRTPVTRRNEADVLTRVQGPDVGFDGVLEVAEPDAFAALLARGVGRHRSFGFGMLMLRPAR
jgi:CRISPR system Cascade subunit CasE